MAVPGEAQAWCELVRLKAVQNASIEGLGQQGGLGERLPKLWQCRRRVCIACKVTLRKKR